MKKFVWLNDSCVDKRGKRLKKGETYSVEDFSPEVVKEWIRTGAASEAKEPEKSKSEVK